MVILQSVWERTESEPDVAPVAISRTPTSGTTNIAIGTGFSITFNQSIVAGMGGFYLFKDGLQIASVDIGDATIGDATVSWTWGIALTHSTSYSIYCEAGVVTSAGGTAWVDPISWTFRTAQNLPYPLVGLVPANGSTVTTEELTGDKRFQLAGADTHLLSAYIGNPCGTVGGFDLYISDSSPFFDISISEAWPEGVLDIVIYPDVIALNMEETELWGGIPSGGWVITHGGGAEIAVVSTSPAHQAMDIDPMALPTFTITFNGAIAKGTGMIYLKDALNYTVASMPVNDATASGSDLSFEFSAGMLNYQTTYHLEFDPGTVVRGTSEWDGVITWEFTTMVYNP